MTRQLLLTISLIFLLASAAFAHPHAFMECTFAFVMDKDGLVGFKQRWALDEITTVSVLDVVDNDRNGLLSDEEKIAIRDLTVDSLLAYHYFTVANVNGKDYPVRKIKGFTAELQDGKLIYEFLVPCRVAAVPGQTQEVKVAVYDDSFYTFVVYVEKGAARIDPTKDPLFANKAAPAHPDDFKRFASAVGLSKFEGDIQIHGNVSKFDLTSMVRDEPEMAYFYKQIIPQAFVLRFELK